MLFLKEIQDAWYYVTLLFTYFAIHHFNASTVNYFFFERWNISELDEIRFYGVAPHWYFRPLMGLLVVAPSHYEGLMWMGLWFILLAALPIIHNLYHSHHDVLPNIPMQSSLLQSGAFVLFMLSMYCAMSMLPCGRYYYEPEGGYVGNPWVKFSYQYLYLYLAWILHHLDWIDHFGFRYTQAFTHHLTNPTRRARGRVNVLPITAIRGYRMDKRSTMTSSEYYNLFNVVEAKTRDPLSSGVKPLRSVYRACLLR